MGNEGAREITEHKRITEDVDVQLIEKILQKSSEKKITWTRSGDDYKGRTSGGNLLVELTRQQTIFFGNSWRVFTVKKDGEEILRLENPNGSLAAIAGMSDSPAHKKVLELALFLDSARQRQVKAAISDLDQL